MFAAVVPSTNWWISIFTHCWLFFFFFLPCFIFPEVSFITQRQTGILSCICINPAMPDIYAVGSYTKSLGMWFGYQRDGEEWEGTHGCSHGFRYLTVHNGAGLCHLSWYSSHSFHSFLHNNRCNHIRNWYQLTLHALHEDTHTRVSH